jgi:hypothetical protein
MEEPSWKWFIFFSEKSHPFDDFLLLSEPVEQINTMT